MCIRDRGDTETFRYDEEGNLSLHIDRDGRQLQRACNVFGQPVYEKASDAEGKHTNISTWHYDSLGRVTRAVCDGKSYEYIYDAYGNLKEKRSNGKRLVSYTHDRAGPVSYTHLAANPSLEELRSSVTANDETNRKNINEDVSNELVEK